MTDKKLTAHDKEDFYKTTFNREIKYEVSDFVSEGFLFGIVDAIAERMKLETDEIKTLFSLDNGTSISV